MRNELFKGINKMGNMNCYLLVTDKGIMMCGNDVEARAMLSQIVHQLQSHGIEDHEILRAVEIGLMTEKEREGIMHNKVEELIEKLFGRIGKDGRFNN